MKKSKAKKRLHIRRIARLFDARWMVTGAALMLVILYGLVDAEIRYVDNDALYQASVGEEGLEAWFRQSDNMHAMVPTTLGRGETLDKLMRRNGVAAQDIKGAVEAAEAQMNVHALTRGQEMTLVLDHQNKGRAGALQSLRVGFEDYWLVLDRDEATNEFVAHTEYKKLEKRMVYKTGSVDGSVFTLAKAKKIPDSVVANAVSVLSHDVDFRREVQSGNDFTVLYEEYYNARGERAKFGDIVYASLDAGDRRVAFYRYYGHDGGVDYYTRDGRTLRKPVVRVPIKGARMSSPYGYRYHPILHRKRLHHGVDWAAPVGTPIFAAGDGVIEFAGRKGGYGNYVRIRHNGDVKTAYAHISRFSKGLKRGDRVKQGQVVAYVGNTGRSTGPHLHYEIIYRGKFVNPMTVQLPRSHKLEGEELRRFKEEVRRIEATLETYGEQNDLVAFNAEQAAQTAPAAQ